MENELEKRVLAELRTIEEKNSDNKEVMQAVKKIRQIFVSVSKEDEKTLRERAKKNRAGDGNGE